MLLTLPYKVHAAPGDIDQTFGTGGGIVTSDVSSYSNVAFAVAIQADNKIVAAGYQGFGTSVGFFPILRWCVTT